MDSSKGPMSIEKRILALLMLLMLPLAALGGYMYSVKDYYSDSERFAIPFLAIFILLLLGQFFLLVGAGFYALVIGTNCFTFRFTKPFFSYHTKVLFLANFIFMFFFALGPFLLGMALLYFVFGFFGIPLSIGIGPLLGIGAFAFLMIIQAVVKIWTPLEKRTILKRLRTRNIPEHALERGFLVGICDMKKMLFKFVVEDDVGMLWLEPQAMTYIGDARDIIIPRERLLSVERSATMHSIMSFGGSFQLKVVYLTEQGEQKQFRLLAQGFWTAKGTARQMTRIADAIDEWRKATPEPKEEDPHRSASDSAQ